jgi:DNA-binding NtrC family response regulator
MSINAKSILIIDDDAAMLRALTRVLRGEGAFVTSASWAGEALDHLTRHSRQFDLIITDLRMPILGGQTILGAASVALPDIPVIVITAFGTPELKAQCLQRGAAAFLEKPLDTIHLLAAIGSALSRGASEPSGSSRLRAEAGGAGAAPAREPGAGTLRHPEQP